MSIPKIFCKEIRALMFSIDDIWNVSIKCYLNTLDKVEKLLSEATV